MRDAGEGQMRREDGQWRKPSEWGKAGEERVARLKLMICRSSFAVVGQSKGAESEAGVVADHGEEHHEEQRE